MVEFKDFYGTGTRVLYTSRGHLATAKIAQATVTLFHISANESLGHASVYASCFINTCKEECKKCINR